MTRRTVGKRSRRTKSARQSRKSYSHSPKQPAAFDASSVVLVDGSDPLAGWTDLRVIATETTIPFATLRRNVPRTLVRKLGRTLYVQRARFVAWWTTQAYPTVLP